MPYVFCYIRPRNPDADSRAVVIAVRDSMDASQLAEEVGKRFIGYKTGSEDAPMRVFHA